MTERREAMTPGDNSSTKPTERHSMLQQVRRSCALLLRRKGLECVDAEEKREGPKLRRELGCFALTMIGIGEIIGMGAFVLTGVVAANNAGPAVILSFLIAAVVAAFAALCYAELVSLLPIAGSSYSFAYVGLGELLAWVVGWDCMLEWIAGAAVVAVGWSSYLQALLTSPVIGLRLSDTWTSAPVSWDAASATLHSTGGYANVPAMCLVAVITCILIVGVKESATLNTVVVTIKMAVIVLFVVAMGPHIKMQNLVPFVPENQGRFGAYGVSGVFQGATTLFFCFFGFDAVSVVAQEARSIKSLPTATLTSLAVSTVLYIIIAFVAVGVLPYQEYKGISHPISYSAERYGWTWLAVTIDVGAIAGTTSVVLVSLLSQPRIFYSMARDGLVPHWLSAIHPRFHTPYVTTIISGVVCALMAGLLPIEVLAELTSIGTLFAFMLVCLSVCALRFHAPEAPRAFRVPGGPYFVPLTGACLSLLLVCSATTPTITRLFAWMAVGLVVYSAYSRTHSVLATTESKARGNTGVEMTNDGKVGKEKGGVCVMVGGGSGVRAANGSEEKDGGTAQGDRKEDAHVDLAPVLIG